MLLHKSDKDIVICIPVLVFSNVHIISLDHSKTRRRRESPSDFGVAGPAWLLMGELYIALGPKTPAEPTKPQVTHTGPGDT